MQVRRFMVAIAGALAAAALTASCLAQAPGLETAASADLCQGWARAGSSPVEARSAPLEAAGPPECRGRQVLSGIVESSCLKSIWVAACAARSVIR